MVKTLGDIWGLLLDSYKDVTCLVIKALFRIIVADFLDGLANNRLVVNVCLGCDFTKDLYGV